MNTVSAAVDRRDLRGSPAAARQRSERYFWSGLALVMALIAFAGFAPSYYLKAHFHAGPILTPLLLVHGAAMTAWIALLVVQTSLIAARRVEWHRRLGIAGAILAALLTVLFTAVAIVRAKQGVLGPGTPPPLVFLTIPLMGTIVFPVLIGAAIHYRRRSDYHKRLIMLASIEIITAAVARLPGLLTLGPLAFFGAADLLIVTIALRDLATLRRLHPATLWGGLFLILSQPLRLIISTTPAWLAFAKFLTGSS